MNADPAATPQSLEPTRTGPTAEDRTVAEALLARVRTVFDVQEAWWFGSRAEGRAGPDSDWDLLIVAPSDLDKFARMTVANRATRTIPVECDLFILTPSEFATDRERFGKLAWAATHKGVRLDD